MDSGRDWLSTAEGSAGCPSAPDSGPPGSIDERDERECARSPHRAVCAGPRAAGEQTRRPSILAVTSELPWPLDTGGHLRTFHILRSLSSRYQVLLVAPVERGQADAVASLRRQGISVQPAPVGPRTRWREACCALRYAAVRKPYVLYGRHDRRAMWKTLRAVVRANTTDILYLDHLDSWLYRRILPGAPVVVDLHNVYSTLARRVSAEQTSFGMQPYLTREATLLDGVEQRVARGAHALMTVSEDDRRHYESLTDRPVRLVPNGVACASFRELPTGRRSADPVILYLGSLSWGPNVVAARCLASEILPRVREKVPGARVQLVGRNPSADVTRLGLIDGVEVMGSVPDVTPYLRDSAVMAVPLEAGGGTRLKILEAFAAGLPVVSTAVGCEGLEVQDRVHLHIAHRDRLADDLARLLLDRSVGEKTAVQARALALRRYDWSLVGEAACDVIAAVGPRG